MPAAAAGTGRSPSFAAAGAGHRRRPLAPLDPNAQRRPVAAGGGKASRGRLGAAALGAEASRGRLAGGTSHGSVAAEPTCRVGVADREAGVWWRQPGPVAAGPSGRDVAVAEAPPGRGHWCACDGGPRRLSLNCGVGIRLNIHGRLRQVESGIKSQLETRPNRIREGLVGNPSTSIPSCQNPDTADSQHVPSETHSVTRRRIHTREQK